MALEHQGAHESPRKVIESICTFYPLWGLGMRQMAGFIGRLPGRLCIWSLRAQLRSFERPDCHAGGDNPATKVNIPELANVRDAFVKAAACVNKRAESSHQPAS